MGDGDDNGDWVGMGEKKPNSDCFADLNSYTFILCLQCKAITLFLGRVRSSKCETSGPLCVRIWYCSFFFPLFCFLVQQPPEFTTQPDKEIVLYPTDEIILKWEAIGNPPVT